MTPRSKSNGCGASCCYSRSLGSWASWRSSANLSSSLAFCARTCSTTVTPQRLGRNGGRLVGTRIIGELRPLTRLPFDVHLMMRSPEWIIPEVVALGANWVSVHFEACPYPHRTLRLIRQRGARAGLAFNPKTPLPDLSYLYRYLDFVLILTTEPEYPDADFLPEVLGKVRDGRRIHGRRNLDWAVDRGITVENVGQGIRAGANVVVCGRSVFHDGAIAQSMAALRAAASASTSI
jgi:ribulose-phosphate 3-epimerase